MTIETVGVDIAKNVFQLHGVNCNGRVVLKPARGRFLGAEFRGAWASGQSNQPAICETLCAAAEERRQRRGSHLYGRAPTAYPLRPQEERRHELWSRRDHQGRQRNRAIIPYANGDADLS